MFLLVLIDLELGIEPNMVLGIEMKIKFDLRIMVD